MIKLADTLAPMADFPAVEAKDVAFNDNKSLQEKYDNGELGSGTSVTVDTEMSDTSENTVQNKIIKKYVDDNLTDVQTELTDIKKELSDGMTLVADAITEKGVKTATDATLEVMAGNIRAIEQGVDTSDATATAIDIMAGKTAYVNGVKIIGTASSSELHGATISVSSSNNELVGTTVTLLKGETIVGTRILDESLVCSFVGIQEIGEYVVSISDGTLTTEENVSITGDNIVNKNVITVVFNVLSRLSLWLIAGRVTDSFSTLDEVFASEITVRQLMTIHASVNVLKEWMIADTSIVDTFVANATAMKWMGLRDYAYDTLTAGVDGLEEKILASDNWEYALKDHVPVMTSNTAPYGEVISNGYASSSSAYYPWLAFDGNNALVDGRTGWHSKMDQSVIYIGYRFNNPVCIKKIIVGTYTKRALKEFEVQGSNDGDVWNTIKFYSLEPTEASKYWEYDLTDNTKYYSQIRLYITKTVYNGTEDTYPCAYFPYLQFYGRSLNVSVPTMTSNTAPYGEASASSERRSAYYAFDKILTSDNDWITAAGVSTGDIIYRFNNAINLKLVMIYPVYYNGIGVKTFEIDASNDGVNWSDTLYSGSIEDNQSSAKQNYFIINNTEKYLYYRLRVTSSTSTDGLNKQIVRVAELQFYGVDYSEREFAEGSTMKYIYDHGVICDDVVTTNPATTNYAKDTGKYLEMQASSKFVFVGFTKYLDLTNYSLIRAIMDDKGSGNGTFAQISVYSTNSMYSNSTSGRVAQTLFNSNNVNTLGLDISSITGNNYLNCGIIHGESVAIMGTVNEWWIE